MTEDPFGINRRMGTFTNFCNLLDMAAVAAPGHRTAEDHPFGVMFVVPAFDDQIAIDLAARLGGVPSPTLVDTGIDLAVFGAHLRGQPLNTQLVDLGARYVETVTTSDAYRLFALDTTPPKPGLVRRALDSAHRSSARSSESHRPGWERSSPPCLHRWRSPASSYPTAERQSVSAALMTP